MPVKHTAVVVTADDGTSEVGSNEWNADHSIDTITAIQDGQTPLTVTRFYVNAVGSYNGFLQSNYQNKSNGTAASTDVVCTTDTGSDTTEYIDMGINGSGYTGSWGLAKDGYLYVDGGASGVGDLVIGTAQTNTRVDIQVAGGTSASTKMSFFETYTKSNVPIVGGLYSPAGWAVT